MLTLLSNGGTRELRWVRGGFTWWSLQNSQIDTNLNPLITSSRNKSVFNFTWTARANSNKWILSERMRLAVFRFTRRPSTTTSLSWATTRLTGFLWSWRWWRDSGSQTPRFSGWKVSGRERLVNQWGEKFCIFTKHKTLWWRLERGKQFLAKIVKKKWTERHKSLQPFWNVGNWDDVFISFLKIWKMSINKTFCVNTRKWLIPNFCFFDELQLQVLY